MEKPNDKAIIRLEKVFREFIKVKNHRLSLITPSLFFIIAKNEGCNQDYIHKETGLSRASLSSILDKMEVEYSLIDTRPNYNDQRSILYYLSKKGRIVLDDLIKIVESK